jgi:hypothetical protein
MEPEKGFESVVSRAFSGTYAASENAPEGSTRPLDASVRVATETDAGDTRYGANDLPVPTPDLFLAAGLIVADRAAQAHADALTVAELVGRAVQQAHVAGRGR